MMRGGRFMEAVVWLLFIGLDVGLAFIPANMAKKKGYSYGGFWCLSFFASFLIAIIVVACISDKTQQAQVNPGQYPPGQGFAPPSAYAPPVQSYNPPPQSNNPPPQQMPQPGVVFCSKCGARMTSSDAFCSSCGSRINGST
jgi:hypothetical protein